MTEPKNRKTGRRALRQALVDEILSASDEDILAQFSEDFGSSEANAAQMRASFEKTVLLANKDKLQAARKDVAALNVSVAVSTIPIGEAREKLRQIMTEHANDKTFTLAARNESELSDDDVLDMLDALRELGLVK
jgi:hypothetical protein